MKQKKDGGRLCNAEKELPKVNSTAVFLTQSEWSGLWILANFRYVIFFLVSKKLVRDTRVNLLVVYSNKFHMHDTLVHMVGP